MGGSKERPFILIELNPLIFGIGTSKLTSTESQANQICRGALPTVVLAPAIPRAPAHLALHLVILGVTFPGNVQLVQPAQKTIVAVIAILVCLVYGFHSSGLGSPQPQPCHSFFHCGECFQM
jgi:hypothetical protein